jgi:hypothetical protein
MLVDGHEGFDVFQVVQALTVSDLIEGANGNRIIVGDHGAS